MSNVGTNQTSSAHAYFLVFGLGIRPRNVSCMCFMDSVHTISSQHSTHTLPFVTPRKGCSFGIFFGSAIHGSTIHGT